MLFECEKLHARGYRFVISSTSVLLLFCIRGTFYGLLRLLLPNKFRRVFVNVEL